MQSNMLHICALLALTAASSAAGLRDLASHDHALPAVHQRALQQAASASAVPYVSQLQGVLTEIEGVPGRPVTYKNVESALYIAYANAGALVPNGGRPCCLERLLIANSSANPLKPLTLTIEIVSHF